MTETKDHDVDGLLRKNAELLGEVKALKARVAEIEVERDAAAADAAGARETMRRVQLEEPLEQALGGAFVAPWRIMRPLVDEHFDVDLGEDGKPQITAKADGAAVALAGLLTAMQAVPDLAAAMRPPAGAGARGNDHPQDREQGEGPARPKVASPFGLR